MSVGEFALPKTEMPIMSGIRWKARPKNGRGGEKRVWGKKFVIWRKKVFCWLGKQNVGWKKNLSLRKKLSVGEFALPKTEMSGLREISEKNGRLNEAKRG